MTVGISAPWLMKVIVLAVTFELLKTGHIMHKLGEFPTGTPVSAVVKRNL